MGIFGKIGGFFKKIGQFGGHVINKIGEFKNVYDGVNNATGGMMGKAIESLPVVGGHLKTAGDLLKGAGATGNVISAARERYGGSKPETLEEHGWRRQKMGLENM